MMIVAILIFLYALVDLWVWRWLVDTCVHSNISCCDVGKVLDQLVVIYHVRVLYIYMLLFKCRELKKTNKTERNRVLCRQLANGKAVAVGKLTAKRTHGGSLCNLGCGSDHLVNALPSA